jgi:hypothetical protein
VYELFIKELKTEQKEIGMPVSIRYRTTLSCEEKIKKPWSTGTDGLGRN